QPLGRQLVAVGALDADAATFQPRDERRQRGARIEMRLLGEEQRIAGPAGEIRLERRQAFGVQAAVAARAPGEALELAAVAGEREHQRALRRDDTRVPLPPSGR